MRDELSRRSTPDDDLGGLFVWRVTDQYPLPPNIGIPVLRGGCVVSCGTRPTHSQPGRSWLPLLEERVLDHPAVILTALCAVDEHLRLRREAADFGELMPGIHR